MSKTTLNNTQGKPSIAAALQEIGTLLEQKGGRYFQARAYKAAARVVAELESCVVDQRKASDSD